MRPHGKAGISATKPRALAICDRCGAMYNHDQLRWQFQWGGPRLINLRVLVCPTCYDTAQPQLKTIILPPDPVPIAYARPENYPVADNPISGIGYSPIGQTFGANIGNLTYVAGLDAAFDGITNKPSGRSAAILVSNSSLQNFIGKNWSDPFTSRSGAPLSLLTSISYEVSSFSVYAPTNVGFVTAAAAGVGGVFDSGVFDLNVFDTVGSSVVVTPTALQLQGSSDGATWTVLYSTTFAGTAGETITSVSSNLTGGNYQYHRVAIEGDGNPLYVAQVEFSVTTTGQNEQ